jgi:hypothetical protein
MEKHWTDNMPFKRNVQQESIFKLSFRTRNAFSMCVISLDAEGL